MFKTFNEFINENHQSNIFDQIENPINSFINRAQERFNNFKEIIEEKMNKMKIEVENIMEEYEDIIVGTPTVKVESDLYEITVEINTNVPNDPDLNPDDNPAENLEYELYRRQEKLEYDRSRHYGRKMKNEIRVSLDVDRTDTNNCIIVLHTYIIEDDNFGEYTDVIKKLGETY
jgi:hypothetical protein